MTLKEKLAKRVAESKPKDGTANGQQIRVNNTETLKESSKSGFSA